MNLRTTIVIGMLALTLAGSAGSALGGAEEAEAGKRRTPKCQGVKATIVIKASQGTVQGTDGRDVVIGTAGPDIFAGNGGDDIVCLEGGNDTFRPGTNAGSIFDGNDTVLGGPGADQLSGGHGDDVLLGEGDGDAIRGQEGTNDLCNGGPGGGDVQLAPGGCETVLGIP